MKQEIKYRMEKIRKEEVPEGYKKTKVGTIPNEWNIKPLSKMCCFLDEKRRPIKEADRKKMQGKYPYYGASGIIDYVNDFIFEEELILLGEDGANILARSTPLAFKVKGKIWVNNHAHVLKPNQDVNITFLTEYLENIRYEKYNTGTAQPKLNKYECERILIPYPSLSEQDRIGDIFVNLDNLIGGKKRELRQKKKQKKGLMQNLLTGKKRLPGFNDELQTVQIKNLLKEIKRNETWDDNKLYRLVSIRRRSGGLFHRGDLYGHQIKVKGLVPIKQNDFLISKMQILHGALGLVKNGFENYYVSGSYIILRARDPSTFNVKFFDYLTQMPIMYHKAYISSYGVHIEKMTFNLKLYMKEEIQIPPTVEEQNKIVQVIEDSNKEINLLKKELNQLKKQKRGLMQLLLTGIVRVNV
jgi:type I restriction enzyme, S subunit